MPSSTKKKVLQGSAANLLQMLLTVGVSLLVPPFLVHHMQQAEYAAWVLILQVSAYINYLEIGIQTAIGKFISEYHAIGDTEASTRLASTAISLLGFSAAIGLSGMIVIALRMSTIFRSVPPELLPAMRVGVLAIGGSSAVMLPFLVLQAIFIGLQRYAVPTAITGIGRVASAISIVVLLSMHGTLTEMALLIAAFNMLNVAAQWVCWRKYASRDVPLRPFLLDRGVARRLLEYCGILAIWTLGSLFISGLDTTIVGRYDFHNTGFYAIASSATNFMLLIVGNAVGPLMPAISSMHSQRTPAQLGTLLIRITRYCALLLMVLALPLLLGGFPLLRLWVGAVYASSSVQIFTVLVLANTIRQLSYPYALMVVATGSHRLATLSPVTEAIVNLVSSLVLVRTIGAIGVAFGTLIGAFAGLGIHILLSMRWTSSIIAVNRVGFMLRGIARPLLCALPSILILPWFHTRTLLPVAPSLLALWMVSTGLIAWLAGLTAQERQSAIARARALL